MVHKECTCQTPKRLARKVTKDRGSTERNRVFCAMTIVCAKIDNSTKMGNIFAPSQQHSPSSFGPFPNDFPIINRNFDDCPVFVIYLRNCEETMVSAIAQPKDRPEVGSFHSNPRQFLLISQWLHQVYPIWFDDYPSLRNAFDHHS
jgi:hypothetical protein